MIRPFLIATLLVTSQATAAMATRRNAHVDYPAFMRLGAQVGPERAKRQVSLDKFKTMAQQGALILDARSSYAFARGHIKGAVNLPFTDFTAESLAATIGDTKRPILIYCNNNFSNNKAPVQLKAAPVALNIQTFINLTGYGYRNVYELADLVDFNDPKVEWQINETAEIPIFSAARP